MRKMVFGRHLSRGRKARRALFRSLIRALAVSGKITTTKAKAYAIVGEIDKIIGLAKENTLAARQRILINLGNDRKTTDLLFKKIAPVFKERKSGFTKLIPLPLRRGDAAKMMRIEWVEKIDFSSKQHVERSKEEKVANDKSDKKKVKRSVGKKPKK